MADAEAKTCPQCGEQYATDVEFCPADGTKLRSRREPVGDPLIGRALDGRWVIESKLGQGGMGAVYRGHQKSVSRTVAIKTLKPQLVESEEFVDRFFREAKIAATIAHPHSVTILDYGEADDGTLYLAMEFLEGQLLTDRISEGTLTVKQLLEIAIQVSSALSTAHELQIVHRDLKPDNIFLLNVPGGGIFTKVLDFGIAKMLNSNTQVTKTGMIFGTPDYMSPEQCRGDVIDGRADLYALGCIMYEAIGGRKPFNGATPMAVLLAHVSQAVPQLVPAATAHLPPEVEQTIMKLLAKEPDARFPSASALRDHLETLLECIDHPSQPATGAFFPSAAAFGRGETLGAPDAPTPGPVTTPVVTPPVGTTAELGPQRAQIPYEATADIAAPRRAGPGAALLVAAGVALVVAMVAVAVNFVTDDEVGTETNEAAAVVADGAPFEPVELPVETAQEVAEAPIVWGSHPDDRGAANSDGNKSDRNKSDTKKTAKAPATIDKPAEKPAEKPEEKPGEPPAREREPVQEPEPPKQKPAEPEKSTPVDRIVDTVNKEVNSAKRAADKLKKNVNKVVNPKKSKRDDVSGYNKNVDNMFED